MKKKNTKSPISDNLLRQPGQSLDEEIQKILDDKILPLVLAPMFFITFALLEWYRAYVELPPNPWLYTIIAIIAVLFSIYKIIPIKKQIKNLRQGSDGEKAVAELLNFFREAKMKVFHDVVGKNFNLDHVVVSTRGIYLIETKTYSKPHKGKAELIFNGEIIIKNGHSLGNSILIQVRAGNLWLTNLIEELTAKKYNVQSAIVFPGWYVKMTGEYKSDTWVVNPKNLSAFINKKPETLSLEDVKLISNHLSRYIKTQ